MAGRLARAWGFNGAGELGDGTTTEAAGPVQVTGLTNATQVAAGAWFSLAVHTMLPKGTGYTTLEFKISFIKGMTEDTGPVRTEGRTLNVGRRAATAEARITDAKGRLLAHATTTCLVFEIPKGS